MILVALSTKFVIKNNTKLLDYDWRLEDGVWFPPPTMCMCEREGHKYIFACITKVYVHILVRKLDIVGLKLSNMSMFERRKI